MENTKMDQAFAAFDNYNAQDPNKEFDNNQEYPKELLYALRMTAELNVFAPEAPEHIKLAARCQHIGRWEIPRDSYAMDKKGYFQWRNKLKEHHARLAEKLLTECGYDTETIERVKFLLMKKDLKTNPETQLIEDIICLVFVEYYLEDFAAKHEDAKVIDILKKTLNKMSPRAIEDAKGKVSSSHIMSLLVQAV